MSAGFPSFKQLRFGIWSVLLILVVHVSSVSADPAIRPGAVEFEDEEHLPVVPADVAGDDEPRDAADDSEGREFVVAPLPSRSPVLGWSLSVPAMVFYRPERGDPDDATWVTGAVGFYAQNESWGAGAFHRMSLGGDQWRVTASGFYGEINYDYFGIGGNLNQPISLNQPSRVIMAEALKRVYSELFIGLRTGYRRTETRLNRPGGSLPLGLEPPELASIDLAALSPRLVYDTRDVEFYPRKGVYLDTRIDISRSALGSDRDYQRYDVGINSYRALSPSVVLATRAAFEYASGDAPFFVFPAFGANNDLRGYQAGLYRDRFLFASQAELRYRFHPRFGAVVFAGIGTVAPDFGRWGESLGAIGAGFRWVAAQENNVSLRLDVARGRDGTEIYLSIGEAF